MNAIAAPSTTKTLLQRSAWELSVVSPKTGKERTFRKYWSKKQGVVIVGDNTDGWVTLWKEDVEGEVIWDSRSPVAKWLQRCISSDVLPAGFAFIKDVHCRFCAKDLSHPASTFAGYGPTCAAKHGLPWGEVALEVTLPV